MAIHTSSDIIAQRYVISSSVSHYTSSAASGSHIFGDSPDDKHRFTGSLEFGTGSAFFKSNVTASGNVTFTGANKKISGSRTSTGSFGRLEVGQGSFGSDYLIHARTNSTTTGLQDAYIVSETAGAGDSEAGFRVKNTNGEWIMGYMYQSSGDATIYRASGTGNLKFNAGNIVFQGANQK